MQRREQHELQARINGDTSMRETAFWAHKPKSTLHNCINIIKSGCEMGTGRVGRAPDLQKQEEDILVKGLQELGDT